MASANLMDLIQRFGNEDEARAYLEKLRWPNGAVCPKCGGVDPYKITPKPGSKTRKGVYKCRACRQQFTVTVGSIMEDSHIPLSKWAIAFHLLCASKKGMSAHQLHRMLGLSYKAAWFMAHRIRYAMSPSATDFKLRGVVEVDETYIGGKVSNRFARMGTGRGTANKIPVVSLVERDGRVRSFVMEKLTVSNLHTVVRKNVSATSAIMTDDYPAYRGLNRAFQSHETVKHSTGEYVRGAVHTNTVEGFFGILKRGINGVYHHVGKQHLARYLSEFDYRYNLRNVADGERMAMAVKLAGGKRLQFKPSSRRAG